MGRYFRFDGNTFNFATGCDVTWRKEYFMDFVFGGERDQRAYGLTRITPEVTARYDVCGLWFMKNVLGTATGSTLTTGDLPEIGSINCSVDSDAAGILNAKVDTWEITVEEGTPVKAEFSAIGKNTTTAAASAYTADFCQSVMMPANFTCTIQTTNIEFSRLALRINNNVEPIFKNSTLPTTLRPQGLEITGRLRVPNFLQTDVTDGSMCIVAGTIGTIYLGAVKFTEIPPRVEGFDLPETEYSFAAFPGCNITAISAKLGNTVLW